MEHLLEIISTDDAFLESPKVLYWCIFFFFMVILDAHHQNSPVVLQRESEESHSASHKS